MSVARRQRTLVRPVSVTGFGYFSGRDVRVEFWPAAEHAGITFVRHDIAAAARVPASAAFRINVPRRTTLELNGIRVEMVEHVLSALAGMRIDNCEVWVDAPEMPGCDGSSKAFVEAIDAAGAVEQRSPVRQIAVGQPIRVGDENSWIEAQPRAAPGFPSRSNWTSASNPPSAGSSSPSISHPIRFAANSPRAAPSFRRKRPKASSRKASANG